MSVARVVRLESKELVLQQSASEASFSRCVELALKAFWGGAEPQSVCRAKYWAGPGEYEARV